MNLVVDEDGILRMSLHSANIHSVRGILASELDTVEQMLRPKAARDRRTRKISQCDKRNKLGALSITVDKAALTHDEIDALRNDLADYYENEVRRHDVDDARNELEAECRAIKRRLQNSVVSPGRIYLFYLTWKAFPDKEWEICDWWVWTLILSECVINSKTENFYMRRGAKSYRRYNKTHSQKQPSVRDKNYQNVDSLPPFRRPLCLHDRKK